MQCQFFSPPFFPAPHFGESLQHIGGVDADFRHRVSPLHDKDGGQAESGNGGAGGVKIGRFQLEKADGVAAKSVHSQGDDQRFGGEFGDFFKRGAQGFSPFGKRGCGRHGEVGVASLAVAFAGFVGEAEEVGEGDGGVAVQGGEEDVAAAVKNVLGSVAVVEVNVQDGDFFWRRCPAATGRRGRRC